MVVKTRPISLTDRQYKIRELERRRAKLLGLLVIFFEDLDKRFACVFKIVMIKSFWDLATYDPKRESEKFDRLTKEALGLFNPGSARRLWKVIVDLAKKWQDKIRESVKAELNGDPHELLGQARKELDLVDSDLIDLLSQIFKEVEKIRAHECKFDGWTRFWFWLTRGEITRQTATKVLKRLDLQHLPPEFVLPVLQALDREIRKIKG